jgi:hypothetical protein
MEPLKIRRKSKTIPFGFKLSSDPSYLEPIQSELDALNEARKYIKNCSYREVSQWLTKKTGRYISHVGLRERLNRNSTTEAKENTNEKAES